MATTPCPADALLMAVALEEPVPAEVQAHIDDCPDCGRRVERLRAEVRALRESSSAEPREPSVLDLTTTITVEPTGPATPGPRPAAIGKYLVVGELDRGGQGLVYRAVHPELQRDVAIKIARDPLNEAAIDSDLLVKEGRLLAGLTHDNLVQVYDLGLHDGRPFLAMELVRGCTLQQRAEQRPFGPRPAAALVVAVAGAVAYLDARGVVHQDIKPKNILIDESGRPRLIDFGLARLRDAWGHADGPSGGTLAFMPPEQARGEADRIGPRSDVFALGGVLYFLLTGRAPFQGADATEVWDRARRCDFDRTALQSSGVPRRLERICLKAMAADPAARYPSAADLAADLERFARRPHRFRRRIGLVAAVVLPLVVLGAWLALRRPEFPVASKPLRIDMMQLDLYRRDPPRDLGLIGESSFAARFQDDDVRVHATLSAPGYCYLIALNPDGTEQLCYPQDAATPPPQAAAIDYPPDPTEGFGLTDGIGLQTFVLVASRQPLRSYTEWRRRSGPLPWRPTAADAVWQFDGQRFASPNNSSELGDTRRLVSLPQPFADVCRALRGRPSVDAVRALAFPVKPKDGTANR
jgi:predicted Ser/Thr protein kinase